MFLNSKKCSRKNVLSNIQGVLYDYKVILMNVFFIYKFIEILDFSVDELINKKILLELVKNQHGGHILRVGT